MTENEEKTFRLIVLWGLCGWLVLYIKVCIFRRSANFNNMTPMYLYMLRSMISGVMAIPIFTILRDRDKTTPEKNGKALLKGTGAFIFVYFICIISLYSTNTMLDFDPEMILIAADDIISINIYGIFILTILDENTEMLIYEEFLYAVKIPAALTCFYIKEIPVDIVMVVTDSALLTLFLYLAYQNELISFNNDEKDNIDAEYNKMLFMTMSYYVVFSLTAASKLQTSMFQILVQIPLSATEVMIMKTPCKKIPKSIEKSGFKHHLAFAGVLVAAAALYYLIERPDIAVVWALLMAMGGTFLYYHIYIINFWLVSRNKIVYLTVGLGIGTALSWILGYLHIYWIVSYIIQIVVAILIALLWKHIEYKKLEKENT